MPGLGVVGGEGRFDPPRVHGAPPDAIAVEEIRTTPLRDVNMLLSGQYFRTSSYFHVLKPPSQQNPEEGEVLSL